MQAYIASGGLPLAYRCDLEVNWTYDRWLEQGEPHVILGTGTLLFGIISIGLYIPCCKVLLDPDLRSVTAYKMLFLISICQIISLIINSIFAGIFFILGIVYCNYPHLNYIVGCFTMLAWSIICITCFILCLSRFIDLWSSRIHDIMFGGKRLMFSFVIIFLYGLAFYLFAKPTVFNSRELAWLFDPLVYPNGGHFGEYGSLITVINNEGTVGLTLTLTLLFFASLTYKSKRFKFKMSSRQKQLFVQSSFSSLCSLTTATIYVSFQFVVAGRWYSYLGLLTWQFASAGELILFLFINQTIRRRVLVLLKLRKAGSVLATASGATNATRKEKGTVSRA